MRTIIINNDLAAINHLELTLNGVGLTNVVSKETSGIEAKESILKLRPKLIILDSDLKEIDSLTLAKEVESEFQDMRFLFLTSREQINVEAFELNQVDFIVKPVEESKVIQSLKKLSPDFSKLNKETTQLISCFKHLKYIELHRNGRIKQSNLNWRTRYAKEIFAYLITNNKLNVKKDMLIKMFWPEMPTKEAYRNLYTHIHLIRQVLQEADIPILINNHNDSYSLYMNGVETDYEFLQDQIKRYKYTDLSKLERAMNLYRGHFLQDENYEWAAYKREKYRLIWLETMEYIIEKQKEKKMINRAIINALYVQNIDPYLEHTYYILMDLYAEIRDLNSVKIHYEKLAHMLKETYNIKPENELSYYLRKK